MTITANGTMQKRMIIFQVPKNIVIDAYFIDTNILTLSINQLFFFGIDTKFPDLKNKMTR